MTDSTAVPKNTEISRWLRELGSLRGIAPVFDMAALPEEPTELFLDWLRCAVHSGVGEPHAATLATIGADGVPDARTLLLKDLDPIAGWAIAGPRSSAKAAQLASSPGAALNFWWQPLLRAVRVRGIVEEATSAEIAADVAARPVPATTTEDWCLWWIRPSRVEFWQGDTSRNHTRLVYSRSDALWTHATIDERQRGAGNE